MSTPRGLPHENQAAKLALARFANEMRDPDWRRRFWDAPDQALAEKDVPVGDLPAEVLAFLKSLSLEELRLMAHMQDTMLKGGLYAEISPSVFLLHY